MLLFQFFNRFQFNDYGIFNKHISNIMSNLFSFIIYINYFLAFALYPSPFQFLI